MQATIIRLLRNGEVTYIHREDLKLNKDSQFYVNRETTCYPHRIEGSTMVMVQRKDNCLQALTKDLDESKHTTVSDEELETAEYIPVAEWKLHLSKGFDPY